MNPTKHPTYRKQTPEVAPTMYTAIPKSNHVGMSLYENFMTNQIRGTPQKDAIFEPQSENLEQLRD